MKYSLFFTCILFLFASCSENEKRQEGPTTYDQINSIVLSEKSYIIIEYRMQVIAFTRVLDPYEIVKII